MDKDEKKSKKSYLPVRKLLVVGKKDFLISSGSFILVTIISFFFNKMASDPTLNIAMLYTVGAFIASRYTEGYLYGIVRAFVPLAEMFGYSTELRSSTQGRGNYSMFFEKYMPVPKNVQDKVLSNKGN